MLNSKKLTALLLLSTSLVFGACNTDNSQSTTDDGEIEELTTEEDTSSDESSDHTEMEHDESGEIPEGLEEETNPTYPVDSEAVILASHMPGMEGVTGTIVGAFDTVAYEVTYDDTETGESIENHKWVVHEEIEDATDVPYQDGDEVILEAYHMPGMEGATATIDSSEDTTVYMVTYTDSETGDTVENHKWVTEDELEPAE